MKPLYQRVVEANDIETVVTRGLIVLVNNRLSFPFSDKRIAKAFADKLKMFIGVKQ